MEASQMPDNSTYSPGRQPRTVVAADGTVLPVPDGWELLPPGDAGLTRRVKAAGPTWTMQERRGRKMFSRGIWAPAANIVNARTELEAERLTPAYTKRLEAGRRRRAEEQVEYVGDFREAVLRFLAFAPVHAELAGQLAIAITAHATPVGSGTVARTERIPIERRAEAAVIAWLRHQTTGYDNMRIARIKGERREVRRMLAEQSRKLLDGYRRGLAIDTSACQLKQALRETEGDTQ